jgi:hypothetical protein
LDGLVVQQPRAPPFTTLGLRDFIVEMIVTQDEVCFLFSVHVNFNTHYKHEALSLVEKPSFGRLMKYLRPSLTDSEIPGATTIRTHMLGLAEEVQKKLVGLFTVIFTLT